MKVYSLDPGMHSQQPLTTGPAITGDPLLHSSMARAFSLLIYSCAFLLGAIGMLGWLLDSQTFRTVLPGLASMKFNTGLCFVLLAGSGFLHRLKDQAWIQSAYVACIALVAALSGLTVLQSMLQIDLGVDQLFVTDNVTAADARPGRMSIGTSTSFLLLCTAYWCGYKLNFKAMQLIAVSVFIIGLLAALGYLFDISSLYSFPLFASFALHTALAVMFLASAALMDSVNRGYLRFFAGNSLGALAAKQLLPYVAIMPFLLSGIVIGGEYLFGYEAHFGIFLLSILSSLILTVALYRIARLMQFIEAKKRHIEFGERIMHERLARMQHIESMGLVAGGIAHDFNNMLLPITWATELGQSELSPDDPVYGYFETIRKSSDKAALLVSRMMQLGKDQEPSKEFLNLNTVLNEFSDILRGIVKGKCTLKFELESNLNSMVADKRQLEQVLLNLVSNACHATGKGGEISIRTESVAIAAAGDNLFSHTLEPGQYVALSVSDNGSGMDEKTARRVLEPFFTTKEKGVGHGLGLATVNKIVRQHGGELTISSEVGQGTIIQILLPATRIAKLQTDARGANPVASHRIQVLGRAESEQSAHEHAGY
ncbi:MAG: ATP-binding protein [Gammaproteobacteria bacterium]